MKKRFLILFIILSILILQPQNLWAQETEATNSADSIDQGEILEKIKERIEENVQNIDLVKGDKDETTQWYAVFGAVTQSDHKKIIIAQGDKDQAEVLFDQNAELVLFQSGKGNSEITSDEVEKDWFAIAMGTTFTNNNNLLAKRITFTTVVESPAKRQTLVGRVSEVDEDIISLTNGQSYSIDIPSKYDLTIKGVDDPEMEDISIDDKAVAIVEVDETDDETSYSLRSIYIIPGLSNPNAEDNVINEATPSAKQATESAEKEE